MLGLARATEEAAIVLAGNARWMWWNLLLALVPVVLAVWLFRTRYGRRRDVLWWAGAVAFVAFLPNAPYVITDVIHLFNDVRMVESDAVLSLAVVPQYVVFMAGGVASYTASLVLLERYVGRRRARWAVPALHGLCAVGIYLGRVVRLNSWDVVLRPGRVAEAAVESFSAGGLLVTAIVFCVLFLSYDVARRVWAARWALLGRAHR